MKALYQANIDVLDQLEELIQHCQPIYTDRPQEQFSAIGLHVRHILDHYRAFHQGYALGMVDYNLRQRDCVEETDGHAALMTIDQIRTWLGSVPENRELQVRSEISVAVQQSCQLASTCERELLYLLNHTVHHMAHARLLALMLSVSLPAHLGLAPATASFQRKTLEAQHA